MITQEKIMELRSGFETAFIDGRAVSNIAYKPQFISNNYKQGKKVLSSIEDELLVCATISNKRCFYYNGRNYSSFTDIKRT